MSAFVVVAVTSTLWSMKTGYENVPYSSSSPSWQQAYGVKVPIPSAAQQQATLEATKTFRRLIVTSAERYANDVDALVADLNRGDIASARHDELAAQSSYDVLRPIMPTTIVASEPIDVLVSDQNPAGQLVGLHAVERALWTNQPSLANQPANELANSATALTFLLLRTILTPSDIASALASQMSWNVENVIARTHEAYSHLDVIDVRAATAAAVAMAGALRGIARLTNPRAASDLAQRVAALDHSVKSLGVTVDSSIPASSWRLIAIEMDAVAAAAGSVAGATAGYGSGRPYA